MELKETLPLKYHTNTHKLSDDYPTEDDIKFDIFNMVLAYNKKKRRKKIQGELYTTDLHMYFETFDNTNQQKVIAVVSSLKDDGTLTPDEEVTVTSLEFINQYLKK